MDIAATNLIPYSDSCGGQNRNVYIMCLLLHIVANPNYPFSVVDHKFMVSGHSYLPNDRDFGSVETAKKRAQHVYLPEDWYELVRSSRRNNPFQVTEMQRTDIVSLQVLKAAIVNCKVNTNHQKVDWLKIRWIQVRKEYPLQFRYRYSHNTLEAWKTIDVRRKAKGRPVDIGQIALAPLYPGPRAINQKKIDDLHSLLKFVPPVHHDFYYKLSSTERDSEAENSGSED